MEKRTRSTTPSSIDNNDPSDSALLGSTQSSLSAVENNSNFDQRDSKKIKMDTDSHLSLDFTQMTEKRAGITEYIDSSIPSFQGIIKQRFTDFMVNEIRPDQQKTVCRITSLDAPPGKYLDLLKKARGESIDEPETDQQKSELEKQKMIREIANGVWPEKANEALSGYFSTETLLQLRQIWDSHFSASSNQPQKNEEDAAEHQPQTITAESKVVSRPLTSKAERTEIHNLIRDLFGGKFASDSVAITSKQEDHDDEDAIRNASDGSNDQYTVQVRWATRADRRTTDFLDHEALHSPPYIHFLLQKTNRDHQEAMSLLAEVLHLGGGGGHHKGRGGGGRGGKSSSGVKDLSVAGTKDKRAVTVQRVALKRGRKTLSDVWRLVNGVTETENGGGGGGGRGRGGGRGGRGGSRQKSAIDAISSRADRGLRIAHLCYASEPLKLGQLSGNEFTITLRNVKVTDNDESTIHRAMKTIQERGFINYYGMQRFGTGAVATHQYGILIFKADYKAAVELMMEERETDFDDLKKAKHLYHQQKYEEAYHATPRNCVAEKAILDKMRRNNYQHGDWLGAFANIPRTLRLMYVHAYQSYIWNRLVSSRIAKFGSDRPVLGDVVFTDQDGDPSNVEEETSLQDDPVSTDPLESTTTQTTTTLSAWQRKTKTLTDPNDLKRFTIHQVVIPLPGFDICLPDGWMSELYISLLSQDQITPSDLTNSKQKEYELRGSFRKLIQLPTHFSYLLQRYTDTDLALTLTDEEKLLSNVSQLDSNSVDNHHPFLSITLHFQLPSSAYATMLLREALKSDTSAFHHKQMTKSSEDQAFKGK